MPIGGVKYGRSVGRAGADGTLAAARTFAVAPVDALRTAAPAQSHAGLARVALYDFDSQLNERISGAQQALQFLDRLGAELRALRDGLSAHLGHSRGEVVGAPMGGAAGTGAIDAQIQRVNAHWLQRRSVTAGTLNSRLEYSAAGDARQNFSVHGLDFESLRANPTVEVLNFSVGGRGHRAGSSMTVEPSLSNAVLVHRFDRALAPSGVRAAQNAQGVLTFSVAEPAWPTVRDTLTVMGEGRRFSTGQFNRVLVLPEAPALRPEEWSSGDIAALRSARQEVFRAQGVVRQAREIVARGLAAAGAYLESEISASGSMAVAEAVWCAGFTETFAAAATRPDYLAPASFTPALMGISRQRVLTVL